MMADRCPVCGGMLVGDGYTMVRHCENVEAPMDIEPDAPTIYCEEIIDDTSIK